MASKAGGRVSTRDWQNKADLALKNDKTEAPQIIPPATCTTNSPPLRHLSGVFSCQESMKPKKLKNQTTLHSPKRLGGLKPPLEQVQWLGDSSLYWNNPRRNKIREEGGLEPPSPSNPNTHVFSLSFRRRETRALMECTSFNHLVFVEVFIYFYIKLYIWLNMI